MSTEDDSTIDRADILIVDDESANLQLLSEMLGREGYRVRPANSPRLAIDSALGKPPDLMLLDVRMPDMDGFEVCRLLKRDARTRDIPILFISALQETKDKVRGFEAGGVDFITKPFQEEEVLARVRTHLKLRRMQLTMEKQVRERTDEVFESEARFRATFDQAAVGIAHVSPEGRFLRLNDKFCDIVGYDRAELLELLFQNITYPDDLDTDIEQVNLLLDDEIKTYSMEKRYVRKTGDLIWVNLTVSLVRDEAGQPAWFVAVIEEITERKKAEQDLQKSRDYLEHLINCIPDAVFSVKLPERIIQWARDTYNVLGGDVEEYIGETTERLYNSVDEFNTMGEMTQKAIQENKDAFIAESLLRNENGAEPIPVEINSTIYREEGEPVSATALIRDISFRKRAQTALQNSEALLKEAQRIARIGSWELDLPTNTLTWSDEIFRIFEIDPKHFGATYEAFLDAVHPDDRDMVDKAYTRSLKNRQPYKIDHRLLMPGGRIKYVHEQCETEYRPEGRPLRSVGTIQDITERKQMEQALEKNEEKLRNAQQIACLGYWEWNLATDQLFWSDIMYQIYEIEPGTPLTFETLLDRVHPADREYHKQLAADLLAGNSGPSFSYHIIRPDGSFRYVYGMGVVEHDDHGPPSRLKGTLQDVTENKTIEMAYHDSEARLKQAQTETMNLRLEMAHLNRIMTMNELAASFAHEINQPLGAIVNNASVAKTLHERHAEGRDDLDEILDDIAGDAQRAGQIISKIRGIMKKGDAVYNSLDINQLLDEVIALYQNPFSLDHISFAVEKDPDLVPVKGDQIRLQQVLMNLISNAMDAMVDSPRKGLVFKTFQSEGMVKVSISDTGPGIEQSRIDQIFDPFYTTKSEGMGIGLRLCKSIIQEHGGRIWAENNRDAGTTFYFTLRTFSGGHGHELA